MVHSIDPTSKAPKETLLDRNGEDTAFTPVENSVWIEGPRVILGFNGPLMQVGFTKAEAVGLAQRLLDHAKRLHGEPKVKVQIEV